MSKQIRSKEAQVQIKKDGQRLGTTMRLILDFKVDSDAEIKKTRFVGDARSTPDLDVKGYDFSFKCQKRDHVWFDLWNEIQQADEFGAEGPEITLTITYAYRGITRSTVVLHGELVLKMDSAEIPSDDYLPVSWSGSCQFMDAT